VKIDRAFCEESMRAAIAACDPERRVHDRLKRVPLRGRSIYGLAIGKAAQAMARGAGPVTRGVCVTHALDHEPLPKGWYAIESSHPVPDERSLAAGDAVCDLVATAGPEDRVLALISGGASALVERPVAGLSIQEFRREIEALAASGVTIRELNEARAARSQIKGGKLADGCVARITTLIASDVVDDDPYVIGSGPTCSPRRPQDYCDTTMPIRRFVIAFGDRMLWTSTRFETLWPPLAGSIGACLETLRANYRDVPMLAWGEPTIEVPANHGEGGRAQQLALELARELRGSARIAFAIGSDGMDGPPPRDRPAPAGAFVDGTTWDAIISAGIDPSAALAHCDAGRALAAVDALVVTGPTGINHADLVLVT